MDVAGDKDIEYASAGPEIQNMDDIGEKSYRELLALSRVSAAVSGLQDLDAILHVGLDAVLEIMGGTIGGIALIDEQSQTLSYRVHRGLSEEYAQGIRLKIGEGIAGNVALTGKAVLAEDLSTDPRAASIRLISSEGLRGFLSVPLRSKEVVLGVLNVASREPYSFTKGDMHLLYAIGDELGVAIEQAALYERVKKGRERYRRLAQHILVAQEKERKRVARELHDETSQTLAGLSLSLQALVEVAENANGLDENFKKNLKKAQSLAVQVSTEVGRLIYELRPTLLDTLGLFPAIRRFAEDILVPIGINVSVESKGDNKPLPPEAEVGLFRIAQGAVGNIAKHADAKNTSITLEYKPDHLRMIIKDDGKGFDVSKMTGVGDKGRGSGLFGMKERVRILGGNCSIQSGPEQGTLIDIQVPSVRSVPIEED